MIGHSDLIRCVGQAEYVPCRRGDVLPVAFWTSDDASEQDAAAEVCRACGALATCRAYVTEHPKEWGVYGASTDKDRRQAHGRSSAKGTAA